MLKIGRSIRSHIAWGAHDSYYILLLDSTAVAGNFRKSWRPMISHRSVMAVQGFPLDFHYSDPLASQPGLLTV